MDNDDKASAVTIKNFWYAIDKYNCLGLFRGGYTPNEIGSLVTELELSEFSDFLVVVSEYLEENSTNCDVRVHAVSRGSLNVVEQNLLPAVMNRVRRHCRNGLYVFDALSTSNTYTKLATPSVPITADTGFMKNWGRHLGKYHSAFAEQETIEWV